MNIWYQQEASRWLEAVPVGNGRLGAMVFGGVETDRLALNESTCWSGEQSEEDVNPEGLGIVAKAQRLLFENRVDEARPLIQKMLGRKNNYGTHLPFGNVHLRFNSGTESVSAYRRELDLKTAIATVEYVSGSARFKRETIASHPDNVLVQRFEASEAGALSFDLTVDGATNQYCVASLGSDSLVLKGHAFENVHSDGKTGVHFVGLVKVVAESGDVSVSDGVVRVVDADSATVYIALGTNFLGEGAEEVCRQQLNHAVSRGYEKIRSAHVADYQSLYGRMEIDLGGQEKEVIPTDRRLAALREGENDPALFALFFQYGRYLIIAGSRHDSPLPMNLQGIWNDGRASVMPWTCDMHLDINTQMNYWPSEVTNLSECHEPLFRWIEESLVPSGRRTAKLANGHSGWVANAVSNAWGYSAAGWEEGWGIFLTGGVWVASHLWERYLFTEDKVFLRETAYPILKEAAEFFVQDLVEDPQTGRLVTGPGVSPENEFYTRDGQHGSESMGPIGDAVLLRDLFQSCIDASEILDLDSKLRDNWRRTKERLLPFEIGKAGQLQEWKEDYEEVDPEHRHVTHMISVFPSNQIDAESTPELAEASRVTLQRKLDHPNFEAVEWNLGWFSCLYARLGDANAAHRNLAELLIDATETNLLTFSAAGIAGSEEPIFVVDGNTGGLAGMAEMLLQSCRGRLDILPALPDAWKTGRVFGLRARGDFEVDFSWEDGELEKLVVKSNLSRVLRIKYGSVSVEIDVVAGDELIFDGELIQKNS